MATNDSSDDGAQGFEQPGWVSIWLGTTPASAGAGIDTLRDLCGVDDYSLDDQESDARPSPVPVGQLFDRVSYAESFVHDVVATARRAGIVNACWMTAQFDFAYDPTRVRRAVAAQPQFQGAFRYRADE